MDPESDSPPPEDGAGAGPNDGPPPEKKRRILQACMACSAKRVKCDGQRPCSTCVRNQDSCAYAVPKKRGPPKGSTRAPRKSAASSNSKTSSPSKASTSQPPSASTASSSASRAAPHAQTSTDKSNLGSHFITSGTGIEANQPASRLNHQQVPSELAQQPLHITQHSHAAHSAMPASLASLPHGQGTSSMFPPGSVPLRAAEWNHGAPAIGTNAAARPNDPHSRYNSFPPVAPSYLEAIAGQSASTSASQSATLPPSGPGMQGGSWDSQNFLPRPSVLGLPQQQQQHQQQQQQQPPLNDSTGPSVFPPPLQSFPEARTRVFTNSSTGSDGYVPSYITPPTLPMPNSTSQSHPARLAPDRGGLPRLHPLSLSAVGPAGGSTSSVSSASSGADSIRRRTNTNDAELDPPAAFFRGGTSGLYGLTTRMRDRDRQGNAHEAGGGVVLRTYSGSRADGNGEDADDYHAHGHGEYATGRDRPTYDGAYHPRPSGSALRKQFGEADGGSGDVTSSSDSSRRPSVTGVNRSAHASSVPVLASPSQSPSHAAARLDPIESHQRRSLQDDHDDRPPYTNIFNRQHTSEHQQQHGPGQGIGVVDFAQSQAQASGESYGHAKQGLGRRSAAGQGPNLAVQVGRSVDEVPPKSAFGLEDDPRLHEVVWRAAHAEHPQSTRNTSITHAADSKDATGGQSSSAQHRPVFSALKEAASESAQVASIQPPEDLDDLEVAVGDVNMPDFTSPLVSYEVEQKLLHLWIANIGTHWTPVAPPTQEDIDAQAFEPESDSEQHQNEAKVQQVLSAWRGILMPERRPLLWSSILSMAADAWGGDLKEAGYPSKARTASSALSTSSPRLNTATSRGHMADNVSAIRLNTASTSDGNENASDMQSASSKRLGGPTGAWEDADWHRHHTRLIGKIKTGRQLSTALFIRARYYLQRTNQEASLEAIQASVFMALRESGAGRASQAAYYSTNACRMALDLGLHRHKAVKRAMGAAFTRYEDECRRRTLWCAFMLDKVIAFILGRPAVLRSAEIECPFPSLDMPDESMAWILMAEPFVSPAIRDRMKGVESMVASTAVYGARLACIGEQIIEQYNVVKPIDWQRWVKTIHIELKEWYESLKPAMEATEPDMPSSHAECTHAVTQVCELLSIYESYYNVRKVSTSLAFILFTSVTIALSNTTSTNPAVVEEAKQRLRELMRWFKKASENYRAARHHLAIINVLAEGIEVGTGGPVRPDEPPMESLDAQMGGRFGQSSTSAVSSGAPNLEAGAVEQIFGGNVIPGFAGAPAEDQQQIAANFTGFAHSGSGYTYPAETLAAAHAAWRGNFGALTGQGIQPEMPNQAQNGVLPQVNAASALPLSEQVGNGSWDNSAGKGQTAMTAPPQVPTGNPLDFLDSQAYLNLQSEAYWGAMPVSSENLLLWNSFHNEYLSALAACTQEMNGGLTAVNGNQVQGPSVGNPPNDAASSFISATPGQPITNLPPAAGTSYPPIFPPAQ
ncbi:hypothetical protein OC845_002763 [Tilletia horrida]|nr:hypothetical protein OC845_002763 [Tilletia horrida]